MCHLVFLNIFYLFVHLLWLSAKFLKLEQLDADQYFPTETTGVSMDGTGQVGTFFYTAPEIEQRWPQINEKVGSMALIFSVLSWGFNFLEVIFSYWPIAVMHLFYQVSGIIFPYS